MNPVNKLILGTVQLGVPYGINNHVGKISVAESFRILNYANCFGISLLDSAESYGNAHQIIGRFHTEYPEYHFKVVTKIPGDIVAESLRVKVEEYVKVLGIDTLEALMFHSFNSYRKNPGFGEEIEGLKSDGLINNFGVSIYDNDELEILIEDNLVDLIQLPFNLLDNDSMRGNLLREAKKKGKIIHTRSAFLQGLFFMDPESGHPVTEKLIKPLNQIHDLAKQERISIAALALGYCLHQPYIDNVLIGVDSVDQLKENMKVSRTELSKELVEAVDNIKISNHELLNPSLWN